ncbi:MAG: hypothetical protein VSS75_008180 [Candidatus Parabeggiatoa sp.]|nr:hypothetical protein [Candidatus Parabeggiatoa sp.]
MMPSAAVSANKMPLEKRSFSGMATFYFLKPETRFTKRTSIEYWDSGFGEADLPDGVFTKSNEPGAYGIGVNLLEKFNR